MKISSADESLIDNIKHAIGAKKYLVKRSAKGALPYDYLVPGGYYNEQWDWDAFFMGVCLAAEISSEAIYLKNWALNYFHNATKEGYTPGCITPSGPEKGTRAFLMKPFIAQGVYFASKFLGDFSWVTPHYEILRAIVTYREKKLWNNELDLGVWYSWIESGADNNPSILDFPKGTIVATDVNTFIYRDYLAMAKIAKELNKKNDAAYFNKRAKIIAKNINRYLWNNQDETYYNYNSKTQKHIKRITYSNLVPLWANLAAQKDGEAMTKRYILNPKKLWSKHGIRTLAVDDKDYNQANIIRPYSNWQGPVWPICNYIHMHGLLNYGFQKEAIEVARRITVLCLNDINSTGGMHECYNADTGDPLAAPNFVSWNLLVGNMLDEPIHNKNPFAL